MFPQYLQVNGSKLINILDLIENEDLMTQEFKEVERHTL